MILAIGAHYIQNAWYGANGIVVGKLGSAQHKAKPCGAVLRRDNVFYSAHSAENGDRGLFVIHNNSCSLF